MWMTSLILATPAVVELVADGSRILTSSTPTTGSIGCRCVTADAPVPALVISMAGMKMRVSTASTPEWYIYELLQQDP